MSALRSLYGITTSFPTKSLAPFRARFDGTARGRPGEPIAIGIDVERLYFFDLATGAAIR